VFPLVGFGLSGETRRLSAAFLPAQIHPIGPTVGSRRQDGKELEAVVGELVGFLDGIDHLVFERHLSA
jgi:hypothetical protein